MTDTSSSRYRIYEGSLRGALARPREDARVPAPAADPPPQPAVPRGELGPACERQMLAVLVRAAESGETIEAAFRRKERELAALFEELSVIEAHALRARLIRQGAGDRLASEFHRLVPDRRGRLLAHLEDARRRAARTHAA